MKKRIAVLDDETRLAEIMAMVLHRSDYEVESFTDGELFLAAFDVAPFDLLLTDLKMPKLDGIAVLKEVKQRSPHTPVILVTAHATVETAVKAMKQGAFDYLTKPLDNDACRSLVRRALAVTALERENRYLRAELRERFGIDSLVAVSEPMGVLVKLARRAAAASSTVLISGESGTGKEVMARSIHFHSSRLGKAFVAVNCKAFSTGVLESELFGHAKGAFTGAAQRHAGCFERADGGTLFLDEIGEVGDDFQAKLLRVLQEREVQPVGAQKPIAVNVRLIAATNRDLRAEVDAGRFREDLYFRLAVIPIELPPLRERQEDILPIARTILERQNNSQNRNLLGWSSEVEAWLLQHKWPGNVRELENTLERGVVLARGEQIEISDLMLKSSIRDSDPDTSESESLSEHLDKAAVQFIRGALQRSRGSRQGAARLLGVERTTLYRLMKRYEIEA